MAKKWGGSIVALAIACTLVQTPGAVAAEGGPVSTVGALRLQHDYDALSNPSAYGYVILNSWEHELIPQIKAANPDARVLVYKDMSATVDYATTDGRDNEFLTAGVGYHFADAQHPDWFSQDENGARIEWCDYPGAWQMDVGNADYQAAWSANVEAELQKYGWDGVMVDDTMANPWAHLCGREIAEYPSVDRYSAATESFLANVGPRLTNQGFLVFPNINDADVATWSRWMGYVSGGVREWWTKTGYDEGKGFFGDHHWQFLQDQMRVTQEAGKDFIGITYSTPGDNAAMRYARASFLMGWDGGRSALIYHTGRDLDPWASDWTVDIGTPVGPRKAVGEAFKRDFTMGTVVVNPSSERSVTVPLGRSYTTADGSTVDSVTVEPTSAVILHASSPNTVVETEDPTASEEITEPKEPRKARKGKVARNRRCIKSAKCRRARRMHARRR